MRQTAGPIRQDRNELGRIVSGNRVAVKTALQTDREFDEFAWCRREGQILLELQVMDEGEGPECIPARRRSLLEYRALMHSKILQVNHALDRRGMVDRRGKLRDRWLNQLQSLVSTALAIDRQLGLERYSTLGEIKDQQTLVVFGGRYRDPGDCEKPL
jgi:hypothetical protein